MALAEGLIEAVTLSLFLTRTSLHGALLARAAAAGPEALAGDQRRGVELARLAQLLRTLPAKLTAQRSACQKKAVRFLEAAREGGFEALAWYDPIYPAYLAEISDPPAVLWLRGNRAALGRPAVAIVGSRSASPYAQEVAEQLAGALSRQGVAVVSGLARGVDAAAHRGALDGPGGTIAVVGSGVDVVYPLEHAALAGRIADEGGALISELPPGMPPLPHHFPRRNRLISGLSLAVVVVEAAAQSGSLITARFAAEQGREVMAVPGNVLSGRSQGAHALIKDGAKIIETANDILEELRLPPAAADQAVADQPVAGRPVGGPRFREVSDRLLRHMDPGEPCSVDDLVERSGMESVALLQRLTDLEIEGQIVRVAGGRFVRAGGGMLT